MTKSQYAKQLQRPEWKAKRLEILERDGNKCVKCGETKRLHVHHLSYTKGRDAWEYPNDNLVTLCGECHKVEHLEKCKEDFVLTFPEGMDLYYSLKSLIDVKVIYTLLELAELNNPIITLSSEGRKRIASKLKVSVAQVTNSIHALKKVGVIIGGRGEYIVNPQMFWKGSTTERIKFLTSTH